jgi:hypothetical protein
MATKDIAFSELPNWVLGAPKIPLRQDEWIQWGDRLRVFVGARLNMNQAVFAKLMGVSRNTIVRWFKGHPLDWDNQNILSNLIFLCDTRGPEKAKRLVEENREYLRNFSPGPWHIAELKMIRERIADLEQMEAQFLKLKERVTTIEQSLLLGTDQTVAQSSTEASADNGSGD